MHSISISHPFPLLTDSLTNVIQSWNSNSKSSTKGGYRGVQVVRDGNKGLQVNNGRCRGVQGGRGDTGVCKWIGADIGVCLNIYVLSIHRIRFYSSIDLLDLVYYMVSN